MEKLRQRLTREERGQGLTEYVIVVTLVAVAAITSVQYFGDTLSIMYAKISNKLQNQSSYNGEDYDDLPDLKEVTKSRGLGALEVEDN